jgi:hypothetical protein
MDTRLKAVGATHGKNLRNKKAVFSINGKNGASNTRPSTTTVCFWLRRFPTLVLSRSGAKGYPACGRVLSKPPLATITTLPEGNLFCKRRAVMPVEGGGGRRDKNRSLICFF